MRGLVELFIDSVFVIIVMYLLSFLDSRVDQFNIIKQSLIIRFIPIVYRMNVLDIRTKIFIRQAAKPFNDILGMFCGNMLAA